MDFGFENPLSAPETDEKVLSLKREDLLQHLRAVHCRGRIGRAVFQDDWSAVERTGDGGLFVQASASHMERLPRSIVISNLAGFIKAVDSYNSDILGLTVASDTVQLETDRRKDTLPAPRATGSVRALHRAKVFSGLGPWLGADPAWVAELRRTVEAVVESNPSRDRKVDGKQVPGTRVVVPLGKWSYVPLTYEPKVVLDFGAGRVEASYEVRDMPDLPPHLEPRWEEATGPRVFEGGVTHRFEAPVPEVEGEVRLPVDLLPDVCKAVEDTADGDEIEVYARSDVLAFRTRGFVYAMPLGGLRSELQ